MLTLLLLALVTSGCTASAAPPAESVEVSLPLVGRIVTPTPDRVVTKPRSGYLTTPGELRAVAAQAQRGIEPAASNVATVIAAANEPWAYELRTVETCEDSDSPAWNDNEGGSRILYAKALAYHLTGQAAYAAGVAAILQRIMTEVKTISLDEQQCRLNFGWGSPELVASADLIEPYWQGRSCTGPTSMRYGDPATGTGACKALFQNWLVKNPYYVVTLTAESNQSNWGAAATNAMAHIADYLKDRPNAQLTGRRPAQGDPREIEEVALAPREAYAYANKIAIDRMNGYRVDQVSSSTCDSFVAEHQDSRWAPVKSQITERGILPDDARREESCNVPTYGAEYQNYPQIHLGNLIQQCELMLRRGDSSCYDNVDETDLPQFQFVGPDEVTHTTHLRPGRGSLERAINAVIVDAGMEWRQDDALAVAYYYYSKNNRLQGVERWPAQIERDTQCGQSICFALLTYSD